MLAAHQAGINAGVFDDLHRILLAQLNAANEIDWSRAVIDGSHIDTKKGVPDLESAPISSPHVSGVEDHARDVDEADPRPDEEPAVRGRLRYPETRRGSKLHVLCEAQGIPLAVAVSGANTQDSLALKPLKLKLDGTAAAAETVRRKRLDARQRRELCGQPGGASTWLNAGVDPTEVAERAGNSVEVLLTRYAKCLDGRQDVANRRIEDPLREYE